MEKKGNLANKSYEATAQRFSAMEKFQCRDEWEETVTEVN